jgi:hypothetical protein
LCIQEFSVGRAEEARATKILGEYFCPITLLGDFPVRTGGVRMGVETILLIVILAFAAGFVLDRLAIRRGRFDAAKSKKEQ